MPNELITILLIGGYVAIVWGLLTCLHKTISKYEQCCPELNLLFLFSIVLNFVPFVVIHWLGGYDGPHLGTMFLILFLLLVYAVTHGILQISLLIRMLVQMKHGTFFICLTGNILTLILSWNLLTSL